jgi:hypothetical protein
LTAARQQQGEATAVLRVVREVVMTSRQVLYRLAIGLLVCVSGCANDSVDPARDSTNERSDGTALFEALGSGANYVPLSLSQMVTDSEIIGVGHMVNVERGMTIVSETNIGESRHETIVVRFETSSVLSGENGPIYLEFHAGPPRDLVELRAALPDQELAVFGVVATRTEVDGVTYENEGSGHPAETTLHRLTTPQGLLVEGEESLVQPLELGGEQLFDESVTSLEAMKAEVEAML